MICLDFWTLFAHSANAPKYSVRSSFLPSSRFLSKLWFVLFVFMFAFNVYPAIWAFYLIELHGWTAAGVGLSLGAFGLFMGAAQAFGLGWTTARIGARNTVLLGLGFSVLTLGIYAVRGELGVVFYSLVVEPFSQS